MSDLAASSLDVSVSEWAMPGSRYLQTTSIICSELGVSIFSRSRHTKIFILFFEYFNKHFYRLDPDRVKLGRHRIPFIFHVFYTLSYGGSISLFAQWTMEFHDRS